MSYVVTIEDGPRSFVVTREPVTIDPGSGGGGGGAVGNVGDVQDIAPVLVSSGSAKTSVNWTTPASAMLEGKTETFTVTLSRRLAQPAVVNVSLGPGTTAADGSVSLSAARIFFPPGQTIGTVQLTASATAGGATSSVVELELSRPDLEGEEGIAELVPRASRGPVSLFVEVLDEHVGSENPTWQFGVPGGAANVSEASGANAFTVQLDQVATAPQTIALAATSGTAVLGQDYNGVPLSVTIPVGESSATFEIEFPDNTVDPPQNPTLVVSGVAQGIAQPGAVTSFELTILNNDEGGVGSSTVRVNWLSTQVTMGEGEARTLTAQLTQGGTPVGLQNALVVPLVATGDTGEFIVDYGLAPNGALLFEAGSPRASVIVNSVANDAPGSIELAFDNTSTPPNIQDGSRFRATANSVTDELEATTLHVPSMVGSRRMIQGLVAVNPPSAELPEYSLSSGERAQVVGFDRDDRGLWKSAYLYALGSSDESIAGESGALGLRLTDAGDTTPAEAAQFVDAPLLQFDVFPGSQQYSVTTDTSGGSGFRPTSSGQWTGEAGRWPQVGPQLVDERYYLMRPYRAGATQSPFAQSPDTCGYFELWEQRIAGDDDVVLYRGQWVNGAWASSDQSGVDGFTENPFTDGEVYLDAIVARSLDAAWTIDPVDAHPAQGPGGSVHALLKTRLAPYFFGTNQPYTFWFAATRVGASGAAERARDYIRRRNIAWAVGGYGPTRNRIWGMVGDATMDWGRADLYDETTNTSGWRAIKELGDDRGDGYGNEVGCINDWIEGGRFPFSQSSESRIGWMHPKYPANGGAGGGVGIYGTSAMVPWWGWWYEKTMELHKVQCRSRYQYRDVVNGAAPFWWVIAENDGGDWKVPFIGSTGTGKSFLSHWHFTPQDAGDTPTSYRLAPTSRPWNTSAQDDPDRGRYEGFESLKVTHMSRERTGIIDCWWGCRDPLAYRAYEARAAMLTRVFPPIRFSGTENIGFQGRHNDLALVRQETLSRPHLRGSGVVADFERTYQLAESLRAYGWTMLFMAGFYGVAEASTREGLRGRGAASARGGRDWFGDWAELFDYVAEDNGVFLRTVNGSSPDGYDLSEFRETDYCGKTGRLPKGEPDESQPCRPATGTVTAPYSLFFHGIFCVRGIEAMRTRCFSDASSPYANWLDRCLRYHANCIAGAQANGTNGQGQHAMPFGQVSSFGSAAIAPLADGPVDKTTEADLRAGELAWLFLRNPTDTVSFIHPIGLFSHAAKSGWTSLAALRALGDPVGEQSARYVYSQPTASDAELIEFFMRSGAITNLTETLTSTGGSARIRGLTDLSFMVPLLAETLNRIS